MSVAPSTGRLRFEPALVSQLVRDTPRRRSGSISRVIVGTLTITLLVGGAFGIMGFGLFDKERSQLRDRASDFANEFKTGQLETALRHFPESDEGNSLLQADNAQRFGNVTPAASLTQQDERALRLTLLQAKRAELESLGLSWDDAQPVGIGGIKAQVFEPGMMQNDAGAFAGMLYFESQGKLFSLELAARRCGNDWIFVDVLSCRLIEEPSASPKKDSKAAYDAFQAEALKPGETAQLTGIRHIFAAIS